MERVVILCIVSLGLVTSLPPIERPEGNGRCGPDFVAKYNLTIETFWSRDVFTKQYPLFRPNAQWSKMLGRSHDKDYVLWRVGDVATEGVKEFAERANSAILDRESQGTMGILDSFSTKHLPDGVGSTSTSILLDENHSRVSTIMKIVPSPDWFVGLNSEELCRGGSWVDQTVFDLGPLDAGTDQGFTYTAPNWPENPWGPVSIITSKVPSHPANSFFYPEWDALPTLARLTLSRLEIDDIGVHESGDGSKEKDVAMADQGSTGNRLGENQAEEPEMDRSPILRTRVQTPIKGNSRTPKTTLAAKHVTLTTSTTTPSAKLSREERRQRKRKNRNGRKNRKSGGRRADCEVGEWGEWAPCSKTCGYGTRYRVRQARVKPLGGGRPCPPLQEDQMCGSMRGCGWNHFSLSSWGKKDQ